MKTAKLVFIYSAIAVFLCFSLIGALGAFGKIDISGWATAAAIIGPCLGIVSAAIGAQHIFNDPDAMLELKAEHSEAIYEIKMQHAKTVTELVDTAKKQEAEYLKIISKKEADLCREREVRITAEDRLARAPKLSLLDGRRGLTNE